MIIPKDWSTMKKLMFLQQTGGGSVVIEDTVSGNPIVFTTDLAKPLKHLALTLLPKQEGTGDPSPENIRPLLPWGEVGTWQKGKNFVPSPYYSGQSFNTKDVQFTVDSDGSVLVNGTASGIAYYNFNRNDSKILLKKGTYTKTLPSDDSIQFNIYKNDTGTQQGVSTGKNATFTLTEDTWVFCFLRVTEGAVLNNVRVYPQIEIGSTATAYETPVPVLAYPVNLRKNLYPVLIGEDSFINNGSATHGNENGKLIINTIASSSSSGVYLNSNSHFRKLLDDVDGQTVTLSLDIQASENASVRIVFCGKQILFDVTPSTRMVSISETVGSTKNFNIYGVNSGATLTVSNVQLEQGEQATAFQPYIPPVYGCSVDLTTGEVWGTWASVDMGTLAWQTSVDRFAVWVKLTPNPETKDGWGVDDPMAYCSLYRYGNVRASGGEDKVIGFYNGLLYARDTSYETPESFKTAVSGLLLVYRLATPVLLATLTPQQINALIGVNTVWSDADNVDVTYLKKG